MVDGPLRGFPDWLFARYREIVDSESNPLARLKGLLIASRRGHLGIRPAPLS
jgi:hypothetical protein